LPKGRSRRTIASFPLFENRFNYLILRHLLRRDQAGPARPPKDPPPFDTTAVEFALAAGDAVDCLEKVIAAIRERRLYGFMVQNAAENAVGAGEWIEMTIDDLLAIKEVVQKRTEARPVIHRPKATSVRAGG
jgi:hypothetical protein